LFQLLYDSTHNVLMTRLYGTYVEPDITLRDKAVARFVARHGMARGIMDYTAVEAVDLPIEVVVRRSAGRALLAGQARVIVAPREPVWAINRIFAAHSLYRRGDEPLLVRSLSEAYQALEIANPAFEPLATDDAGRLAEVALGVLSAIDAKRGATDAAERERTRRKMLALLDNVMKRELVPRDPTAITLSDVLNAELRHATLTDADLRATCTSCSKRLPLSRCTVSAGRETTYACPGCGTVMIVLAPAAEGVPNPSPAGYEMGHFVVRTAADIDCPGARLPKCEP
jgi:hypothetical protein